MEKQIWEGVGGRCERVPTRLHQYTKDGGLGEPAT